jgi:hypothetical protein
VKDPGIPKARYSEKLLKYLCILGEVLNPKEVLTVLRLHYCSWATGIQEDLVGQWSKSNYNTPPAGTHEVVRCHNINASAHRLQVHYLEEPGPSTWRSKHLNTTQKVNERKGLIDSLHDKT